MLIESPACIACMGVIIAAIISLVQKLRTGAVLLCCTLHTSFSSKSYRYNKYHQKPSVVKLEVDRLLALLGSREDDSGCKVLVVCKQLRIATPLCT